METIKLGGEKGGVLVKFALTHDKVSGIQGKIGALKGTHIFINSDQMGMEKKVAFRAQKIVR